MTEEEIKENEQIKEDYSYEDELSNEETEKSKKDELSNEKVKRGIEDENASENDNGKDNLLKEIRSYVIIIVAAVLVAVFVNTFIISNTRVPTGSMENTIMCGNRLFGNRLAYKTHKPKRGDVVIFKFPDDETGKTNYIKRVIGLPGETVNIVDGVVYIDGKELKEDYLKEKPQGSFGPYEVPEKSYFVMGDNRNNSSDARFWENTYVTEDKIIAKAVIKYWPNIKLIK